MPRPRVTPRTFVVLLVLIGARALANEGVIEVPKVKAKVAELQQR